MKVLDITKIIDELFEMKNREVYLKESGLTFKGNKDVKKIGYCVNLTMETIEEAIKQDVQMLITHHDAWDEIYELREACIDKLSQYGISHYYNHLPLDDCDFGTNDTLLKKLNLDIVKRTNEWEGLYFGRVAEAKEEIEFNELVKNIENLFEEPVRAWKFNDKKIKRVGLVCGNGAPTACLKEAIDNDCDVYITGECNLYTIQYANFKNINLIIGSRTFTELFGIESLAFKLKDKIKDIEIVKINEEHYEFNIK